MISRSRADIINATTFGNICPQAYPSVPNAPFVPGNEDCLFLNVYAPPTLNSTQLPVFVWIHGGGYGLGDGRQDLSELITATGNGFVGVTIQYRVCEPELIRSHSELIGLSLAHLGFSPLER